MCFQGMVCVQEDQAALCIVRDLSTRTDGTCPSPYSETLPCSTTVRQFVHQVASYFNYKPSNIELILTLATGTEISLKESSEETLQSCGIRPDSRNSFILQQNRRKVRRHNARPEPRAKRLSDEELNLGTSPSPTTAGECPTYHISAPAPPATNQEYPYTTELIKQDTGYVGLVNQAMTCYLNSLLQALFMTPEFRNALYKWKYDNTTNSDPAKCIPYQLQRLFLNLQTSHRTAVETTELTKSFGWDSNEAWQQHDIQELCRVMFDALEQVFKGTNQADLIDRLYQGKMIDYVKCLECGKEKSREDTFLDIPLPVRPFGSTVAYGSVVEALRAFVQPETLEGANQYFCEACTKKCNAHKGLKFTKFPYLLTLHLKRFDFDYSTMHRIKLNDKVTFPEILDLNGFVEQQNHEKEEGSEGIPDNELTVSKCDDSSTTDSGSALDDESCQGATDLPVSQDINQEDDEGIDVSGSSGSNHHENEKNRNHSLQKGPYLYELFSIMIHSGSASGGHYYAYIKDFANSEWFCFNDTSVSRITNDDIAKSYGGGALRGYYSGAYSSSTNAYMLMYRQISDENCSAMKVADFPPHIKDLYNEMEESRETDRRIKERHADTIKVKVYCHHPSSSRIVDSRLYVDNSATLGDVTAQAYDVLKLEDLVDLSNCRLVSYNPKQESIEMSFEGKEKELFTEIMASVKLDDLLLEIKNKDEEFEVYQPGGVTVKLYLVNVEKDEVEVPPTSIRSLLSSSVAELKESVGKIFNIDQNNMILVTEKYTNEFQILEDDTMTLQNIGFYTSNKVYISKGPLEKPFIKSKLYRLLDRFEHVITLNISLPDTDPDTLARMSIPSLSSYNAAASAKNNGDSLATTPVEKELAGGNKTCGSRGLMLPLILTGGGGGGDEESGGMSSGGGGASGGHSDQSTSEDSSLTDSDRTLIGDVQEDCWLQGENQLAYPPEEEAANVLPDSEEEIWDTDLSFQPPPVLYTYFKATPCSTDSQKMLRVQVDKRMSVNDMKVCLEPYVGVPVTCFKLYHSNTTSTTEYVAPRTRPCEMLTGLCNEDTLTIRLARQLTNDELKVKVYQLILTSPQPIKYLCEWIIAKGGNVGQTKKEIIDDVNKRNGLNLQYSKCRLRKKYWKNVGRVYLDNQTWVDDIMICGNADIFIQELAEPEQVTSTSQVVLFVRHWRPSTLTLDPFQEVILDSFSVDDFKQKLSQMSNIPVEHIEIAKPSGFFPCDMSVLTIHTELTWNPQVTSLEGLQISDDGGVIFYRDDREELKILSQVEKIDLGAKETARLCGSSGTHSTYSPRKEKPLKIYLDRQPCYSAEADND